MQRTLSSRGNPDISQNPFQTLSPEIELTVTNVEEASRLCRKYITQYNLGGGNWTGGQISENGREIARVSYNGRVWNTENRCTYGPSCY